MFDVGFSELIMIGLVSLLVIGPERLPKVARIVGFWIGKSRAMVASVKAEIKQELHEEEIRQIFKEQLELEEFHAALNETNDAANAIKDSLSALPKESLEKDKPPHEPE
ncbi:Sec-independent protein translocase protein TatB [Methylobacter psychrophilus]|uniref:Sec-independent protein translocase protein TatB n=1 Tax=Methylobacter psychrophilus TaxID=96941 RepID=UPI0021D49EF4|nr:Sec-independent protein translocase protein TatB [Methylobacter psychrophilus]